MSCDRVRTRDVQLGKTSSPIASIAGRGRLKRMMKHGTYAVATFALLLPGDASAASLTVSDGICEYRVAYSPAKVDGARLKATFDYLNESAAPMEPGPTLRTADDIAAIDVAAYRGRCADHRQRLETLRLIDVPGLDNLRKQELDVLEASCRVTEASLAGAKGDAKPMRNFAPACGRYADLIDLPPKTLKARWNDLVVDLCAASTKVNVCAGRLQRDGEGPGSEARRRLAVVARWGECAAPKVLAEAGRPDAPIDREKRRLQDLLAKRFKMRTLSCAR